jgi:hypothetical protein
MNMSIGWLGAIAVFAGVVSTPFHHRDVHRPRTAAAPACTTDANYQRLAFWVGDWEVVDSSGAHYATQRVRAVIDACAITAEWTGRVGDRGMNLSSFDGPTGEWRQMYVSNQVPAPLGVQLRRSDPTYGGPGVRFIPLLGPPAAELSRSRVTIMPLSDHRAMQLFEDSKDGGKTWHVIFKAEHRQRTAEP